MLTRISPALAVANWVTTHSALFGDQMPIRSPGSSPSATSPAAKASTRSPSSRQLQRICWWRTTSASRSPIPLDDPVEIDADRLADQRRVAGAVDIARLGHPRSRPNSGPHHAGRTILPHRRCDVFSDGIAGPAPCPIGPAPLFPLILTGRDQVSHCATLSATVSLPLIAARIGCEYGDCMVVRTASLAAAAIAHLAGSSISQIHILGLISMPEECWKNHRRKRVGCSRALEEGLIDFARSLPLLELSGVAKLRRRPRVENRLYP